MRPSIGTTKDETALQSPLNRNLKPIVAGLGAELLLVYVTKAGIVRPLERGWERRRLRAIRNRLRGVSVFAIEVRKERNRGEIHPEGPVEAESALISNIDDRAPPNACLDTEACGPVLRDRSMAVPLADIRRS